MSENAVLFEKKNGVGLITTNMPEKMNCLTPEIRDGLAKSIQTAKNDDEVKAVILTGKAKAFCAGGDINSFVGGSTVVDVAHRFDVNHEWAGELYKLPKPTIAAVNGYAVGAGFGIALLCDVVFSGESAKFGMSFVNMGLSPDYIVAYILPRIVGIHKVKDLFFTARNLAAREAYNMGIVNAVIPDAELMGHALEYAEKLAKGPSLAYRFGKKMINEGLDTNFINFITMEAYYQSILLQTDDSKNAAKAFLNRTKTESKA
jgi:2-(1,2-epoxy-1,2-dihydrophenyl)acetyl-CoA isomerase